MKAKPKKSTRRRTSSKTTAHILPKQLSEKRFERFFAPFLSVPKTGKKPKVPFWKILNYIIYQIDTGCQWNKIPIHIDPNTDKPETHYTYIFKWFKRWSEDGSFERAFAGSVRELKRAGKLRTKILHGDGTNSIAKKGAKI